LKILIEKFTNSSVRVRRLYGMLQEAMGEYDKALETYNGLLAIDETDTVFNFFKSI
jgi:hypothetical protein